MHAGSSHGHCRGTVHTQLHRCARDFVVEMMPTVRSGRYMTHLKCGRVRVGGQKTEHLTTKRCIKLMDRISNYAFDVDSPVILVFVHSCHIDSLSLSLGTRVYCSLALKARRHSTCQLSLAVLSCELWKAGCLADKNHAPQHFHCTEPWTDAHKATDFIPSAFIWEQYLSPV